MRHWFASALPSTSTLPCRCRPPAMATPLPVPAHAATTHVGEGVLEKTIVVFGASWCKPGTPLYDESVRLGAAIAAAGFQLVNGGYYGTMEGTARGAAEVGGTERVGVIVPTMFTNRSGGNGFLTTQVESPSLLSRIETMIRTASLFIVMPGTLGTLTELCAIWGIAALGGEPGRPAPTVVCYRDPWQVVINTAATALGVPTAYRDLIQYVDTAAQAVAVCVTAYHGDRVVLCKGGDRSGPSRYDTLSIATAGATITTTHDGDATPAPDAGAGATVAGRHDRHTVG